MFGVFSFSTFYYFIFRFVMHLPFWIMVSLVLVYVFTMVL